MVRWAGSPRWNDLYPRFIWNLLYHYNQKVCYVPGKRFISFKFLRIFYNKQLHKAVRNKLWQNFGSFEKKKKNNLTKENAIPPCWAGRLVCVHMEKFSSHLGGIPLSEIKWDLTQAGCLTSHMNTLHFYRTVLKKVRSHLDELANLIWPDHLHMNAP